MGEPTLDELVTYKNRILLDLDLASKAKVAAPPVVRALALEGARLEEKIAELLEADGRKDEAAINWTSAASCFHAAGKDQEARRALDRAAAVSELPSLHQWIKNYRKQLS